MNIIKFITIATAIVNSHAMNVDNFLQNSKIIRMYKYNKLVDKLIKNQENIVIMGKPGSGKGTLSQTLAKQGHQHIGLGDILRSRYKEKGEIGDKIRQAIDNGKWLSDDFCAKLLYNNAKKANNLGKKFTIEGFPIISSQAKAFQKYFANDKEIPGIGEITFVLLDISDKECKKRIRNRLVCPNCFVIYNKSYLNKSTTNYRCKECGCLLKKRKEDISKDRINKRINKFNKNIINTIKVLMHGFPNSKLIIYKNTNN